jgi:hypothetical protein
MKMLTSVVFFTFAYCSMFRVLLPSLRRHPSVVRVRMVLRSLRLSGLPTANAWVIIADTATPRDRNDPVAIDNDNVVQDFERHSTLQCGQADRRRDRRRHRRKRGCIGRQRDPSVMAGLDPAMPTALVAAAFRSVPRSSTGRVATSRARR